MLQYFWLFVLCCGSLRFVAVRLGYVRRVVLICAEPVYRANTEFKCRERFVAIRDGSLRFIVNVFYIVLSAVRFGSWSYIVHGRFCHRFNGGLAPPPHSIAGAVLVPFGSGSVPVTYIRFRFGSNNIRFRFGSGFGSIRSPFVSVSFGPASVPV